MTFDVVRVLALAALMVVNIFLFLSASMTPDGFLYFIPLLTVIMCVLCVVTLPNTVWIIYFPIAGILYFNFQWYVMSLADTSLINSFAYKYNVAPKHFVQASYLLAASLAAICLGYNLISRRASLKSGRVLVKVESKSLINLLSLQLVGSALLLLSIVHTGFTVGSTFIDGSSYYTYTFRVVVVLIAATYLKVCSSMQTRTENVWFTYALTLLFMTYAFVGGDRGPILTILLVLIFGWLLEKEMRVRSWQLMVVAVVSFLAFIGFKVVEVFRLLDIDSLTLDVMLESYFVFLEREYRPDDLTRATAITLKNIEEGIFNYTFGVNFLTSLVGSIPGIGSYIVGLLSKDGAVFGSAEMLSVYYGGINYNSGFGTTYIADLYLEFGIVGVILGSMAYGSLAGSFERRIRNNRNKTFGFYLLLFVFVGSSFYVGRSAIWYFLIIYIHSYIIYLFIQAFFSPFKKGRIHL